MPLLAKTTGAGFSCHFWTTAFLLALCLVSTAATPPADLETQFDVPYGEAGGQKLVLDLFRPLAAKDATLPAIVIVHGGGWAHGSKKDFDELAMGMARRGFVTASVDYRLVTPTGNRYPAQLDDVQRSVRWLRAHATQYHLNPDKMGALGASAGGHLVALLGTVDTRDNSDADLAKYSSKVQCVVDMCGPVDLSSDFSKHGAAGPAVQKLIDDLIGKSKAESPDAYKDASPLFFVSASTVPFLIFHGVEDELVPLDQSQRFDAALKKVGVESKLLTFEGEGHGLKKTENLTTFVLESAAFFNRHLK